MSLAPTGPSLARKNRPILAPHLGWPDGAVEACERVEEIHPDWLVWYHPGPSGGYSARTKMDYSELNVSRGTPDELIAAIEAANPRES